MNLKLQEEKEELIIRLENVRYKQPSALQMAVEMIQIPSDQHPESFNSRYRSKNDFGLHYRDPSHPN